MDVPLSGWRRTLHKRGTWMFCPMILLGFGYRIVKHEYGVNDVDYSKYLGPKWREKKFEGKRVPTIVANHIAFLEVLLWMSVLTPPAFTPASFVQKLFLGNHYTKSLQCVYIDRTATKEELDRQVARVTERQKLIMESDDDWGPLCFFAEGSVTNGLNLSRFRRGAFQSGLPVQPVYQKYHWKTVSPDYASVKGLELSFIMISELAFNSLHAHTFPVFVPNDYLYTEYAKTIPGFEKMEKWEIYAHAVEDFMRTHGNFGTNDQ